MFERLTERTDLWEHLAQTDKPIFLYGMGNGADKILGVLERRNIPVKGVFASDEFVRGHSFRGFPVRRYAEVQAEYGGDFIALLCFGIDYEPMLSRLYQINRECEFYAPDVPVIQEDDRLFDAAYLQQNEAQFDRVYAMLADEISRKVFLGLLNYKLSGKIHYLHEIQTEKEEAFSSFFRLTEQEDYVDLGAYRGDTIAEFLRFSQGKYATISAWEPDAKNYEKLCAFLRENRLARAEPHPTGAWDCAGTLYFKGGKGGRNSMLSPEGTRPVAVDSVDHLLQGRRISLLKLDVEGAESRALAGAAESIAAYRPKIILSAYHKPQDLWDLPLQLAGIVPSYQFYLRQHPCLPAWDVNYYCICS
jgi:FkbM family methyltransferase